MDDPAYSGKPGFWPISLPLPESVIDEAKIDWKKKVDDDKIMVKGSFLLPTDPNINPSDPSNLYLRRLLSDDLYGG